MHLTLKEGYLKNAHWHLTRLFIVKETLQERPSRKKIARHGAQVQETTTYSTICEWHQLNLAYLIKPPGLPSLHNLPTYLPCLPTHVAYLPMGHTCMHLLGALFNLHSNYVVVRACNNPLPTIIPLCNLWRPCP